MSDDWIAEAYRKPDPRPYLFNIGRRVRLRNGRSHDGQTPKHWDGAMAVVESRYCTGILKEHWYKLRLPNGLSCVFREKEIDMRYSVKSVKRG